MMGPKPLDGGENGTTFDLENGTISNPSHEDHGTNINSKSGPAKKMMSRLKSGSLLISSKIARFSPSTERFGEVKEKLRKKVGKPPRPPRPPRHPGSSVSGLDMRIARQLSERVTQKRAKLEKMRSWKRTRNDKVLPISSTPSTSSSSSSSPSSSPSPSLSPSPSSFPSPSPSSPSLPSLIASSKISNIAAVALTALFCYVIISQGFLSSWV